jgi:hypothetical protein
MAMNERKIVDEESEQMACWCGAKGSYDDLFAPLPARCGGSGYFDCHCGGDLCVCHNHGEVDCVGCQDCEGYDDEDDWHDN